MIELKVTDKVYGNTETEYEGKPMLVLQEEGNTNPFGRFQFGLAKAVKILDNIEDIKKFVEHHYDDIVKADTERQKKQAEAKAKKEKAEAEADAKALARVKAKNLI